MNERRWIHLYGLLSLTAIWFASDLADFYWLHWFPKTMHEIVERASDHTFFSLCAWAIYGHKRMPDGSPIR